MILDYNYNNYSRRLDVSYIEDNGSKQILSFNVNRFKAYYSTPNGSFTNWAGDKCDIRWVEKPSKFEIHTFLTELDERYKKLLHKRAFPKVYTFDIETLADENGEYSEPEFARCPISTISVCSPELNTLVLGTLRFSNEEKKVLDKNFEEYINNTEFFKKLNLKMPYVRYVYFQTEEEMIKYFLQNIVSKVPILTGWNCIKYDWNYIVNRIKNYYPSLSIKLSSCNRRTTPKRFQDRYGNEFRLPIPEHTLILDMMDIIETEDKTVLPMKESMKLDYIASASMGIHKIEYTRSLDDLYRDDYGRYVFYNSIDSVLVQLINYRFKALDHIYLYSLYCNEKISSCFSKIAVSEALVFKDFYELGIKIAYEDRPEPARSALLGAYVKKPVPGIHSFVSCNDFAALYPSSMRTCNLSFENYIGAFWDTKKLEEFKEKRSQYVVIGPNVLVNEGTADKPKLGRVIATYLDEEKLAPYRKNTKKYFVSVNGCVYYNDKDYAFRRIQSKLQAARDHDKYLGKKIDAMVLSDIDLILEGHHYENQAYPEDIIETLEKLGINDIKYTEDFKKYTKEQLESTRLVIQNEVIYLDSNQLAMKLMMNSIYGGASNINFYWYNMNLANDITGEARDLIHRMEHHIPDWFRNNWTGAKWLHEKLGVEVDEAEAKKILETAYFVPESVDPDTYNKTSFVLPVYGDTDSLYLCYDSLIKSIKNYEKMSLERKRDIIVDLNTEFLNPHNREFIKDYYDRRGGQSVHNFELETLNKAGVWLNVKKRYAQLLLWKDGKKFEMDHLKIKVTGLEMNKAAAPTLSRTILNNMVRFMLENADDKYLIHKLNIEMKKYKEQWDTCNIDDICENVKVNAYKKYIINDSSPKLVVGAHCPANARALANYNRIRNVYKLKGDGIYSGKVKMYEYRTGKNEWDYFAYEAMNYPEWASEYAKPDRDHMFQKYVLDPMNRILSPSGLPELNIDHSVQMSLF